MTKIKASVFALGAIILVLLSIVGTYFTLLATGSISTEGVKLEIKIADAEKDYDGEALIASEYEITSGTLLKDNFIDITYTGAQTDVGFSESNATVKIVDKDKYDVTKNYNIKVTSGNLTVKKRDLSVKADDETLTYTGGTYTGKNYTITKGSLVLGHKAVPTFKTVEIDENTNKGKSELELLIYDSLGYDVTKNYSISYDSGTVTVDKIALNVRTLSASKEYDGEPLDDSYFKYELVNSSLSSDYTLDVDFETNSVVNVSDSSILTIKETKIYNSLGEDITKYFVVTRINTGVLSITPHEIDIILDESNNTREYDGTEFYNITYSIKDQDDNKTFSYNDKKYTLKLDDYTKITNAGSVQNNLEFTIEDQFGADVTENFDINQSSSILTVTKKNLIVYGESIIVSSVDDEDELKNDIKTQINNTEGAAGVGINDTDIVTGILSGHYVYIDYVAPSIETGKNDYTLAFSISVKTRQDLNADDVTKNYNATSIFGSLSIKTTYTLYFSSGSKTYDGTNVSINDISNFSVEDAAGNTVNPDLIKSNIYFQAESDTAGVSMPDAGTYKLTPKLIDESVDYSIDAQSFNFEIEKRETTIVGEIYEATYTGFDISYMPASASTNNRTTDSSVCSNLVYGHSLKIEYEDAQIKPAGIYPVSVNSIKIYDASDNDVTGNYNATAKDSIKGSFVINKATYDLQIFDQEFDYDGTDHYGDLRINIDTDENLKSNIYYKNYDSNTNEKIELKNAGSYVVDAYLDSSVSENYDINVIYGTVTINKAKLTAIGKNIQCEYNGSNYDTTAISASNFNFIGLVSGDNITSITPKSVEAKNAGTYNVGIEKFQVTGSTADVTANYEIDVTPVILEITRITVVITTTSVTSNDPVVAGDYETNSPQFESEFNIEASILTTVGSVANTVTISPKKADNLYSNYNIIIQTGTLTKTP